MNTDWEKGIAFVLKEEGGYSNDPTDHGGETNFGISKNRYPAVDIKNLTAEIATDLYKKDFWNYCHCDELPSPLAIAVFDAAVNQGEKTAIKMLQIALNVTVDGIIGNETITASFKAGPKILRQFLAQRMVRYIRIIVKTPDQQKWADNWSSHLMRLAELTLRTIPQ